MGSTAEEFLEASEQKAFDVGHRRIINNNIDKYSTAVARGLSRITNLDNAKRKGHVIKWKVMENLDKFLPEFEANFQKRGGKVIWANDAEEANREILNIIKKAGAKTVVKSKSMVTEEIHLNEFLENNQVESLETDLGEYIVQLLGQKPYHIVTPAMHLSKEDIAKLFHERFGTPADATPEQLTQKARELLRDKYLQADVGITGANFLLADTGSIAISENEGNARLCTTFPKIHIAVVGIEKIIPSITDLDLFWPMLSTHGTGQNLTVYNTILSGPRQPNETDGPDEMYVILLDNGRTNLLAQKDQRQGLYCIRCGACLNVCPVYKNIGGHTYNTTYSGPIGSIITPHTRGMGEFKHLSYASSLCGRCTEVCPVKIDIHKMLLLNRRDAVNEHLVTTKERWGWSLWKKGMLKRSLTDFFGGKMKNYLLKTFFKNTWGHFKEMPNVAERSFSKQWQEKHKPKKNKIRMRKIILNLAISLDGFIEGPNGEYDWCFTDQDYGMTDFLNQSDTIFIGRKSYELLMSTGPELFAALKLYVFSNTLTTVEGPNTEIITDANFKQRVNKIREEQGGNIWLFGGAELVSAFIEYGLISEYMLSVHPVILGSGRSLFAGTQRNELIFLRSEQYSSGLVQLYYAPKPKFDMSVLDGM